MGHPLASRSHTFGALGFNMPEDQPYNGMSHSVQQKDNMMSQLQSDTGDHSYLTHGSSHHELSKEDERKNRDRKIKLLRPNQEKKQEVKKKEKKEKKEKQEKQEKQRRYKSDHSSSSSGCTLDQDLNDILEVMSDQKHLYNKVLNPKMIIPIH